MFELSVLKQMKLAELQEIAKLANIKSAGIKKDALVQQILDKQNESNVKEVSEGTTTTEIPTPKRNRIVPVNKQNKTEDTKEITPNLENNKTNEEILPSPERKVIKFNKAKYENKTKKVSENSAPAAIENETKVATPIS